jgi:hypothetical protein
VVNTDFETRKVKPSTDRRSRCAQSATRRLGSASPEALVLWSLPRSAGPAQGGAGLEKAAIARVRPAAARIGREIPVERRGVVPEVISATLRLRCRPV